MKPLNCDNVGASFTAPDGTRGVVFDIGDHLTTMFREDDFRKVVDDIDWSSFAGKNVLVRGCGKFITPPWAYMVLAAKMATAGAIVSYGEPGGPIPVFE